MSFSDRGRDGGEKKEEWRESKFNEG